MSIMNRERLHGSILLLSIMIILILSVIGLAIVRTQAISSENIAQEVLGTRALMAARAGVESNLSALFPLNTESGNCNVQTLSLNTPGLENCTVNVTCTNYATVDNTEYYRVRSTGQCGTGTILTNSTNVVVSSRTIQVEARSVLRQ